MPEETGQTCLPGLDKVYADKVVIGLLVLGGVGSVLGAGDS